MQYLLVPVVGHAGSHGFILALATEGSGPFCLIGKELVLFTSLAKMVFRAPATLLMCWCWCWFWVASSIARELPPVTCGISWCQG